MEPEGRRGRGLLAVGLLVLSAVLHPIAAALLSLATRPGRPAPRRADAGAGGLVR